MTLRGACQVIAVVVLLGSISCDGGSGAGHGSASAPPRPAVSVSGPGLIRIDTSGPFFERLTIAPVTKERVADPTLTVAGSVVARLANGKGPPDGRWDFSDPQVATIYAEWVRSRAAEPFTARQAEKTRELAKARVAAQTRVVERLRKLVQIGTDAPKDLAAAEAELVQTQLETQRQVYEAESALQTLQRTRVTLERQLSQAGVPPELLANARDGTAIVAGEVPEGRLGVVQVGNASSVRFLALPTESFPGRVVSLGPSLTPERRTLRVFLEIPDPKARLRPGLFAEVGLGVEPREALFVPNDAVLHIGRSDYVLVRGEDAAWRVTAVDLGSTQGADVEVLAGVASGESVIGTGAVLLKPVVVEALTTPARTG